jgi:glycosyltransferase involved in cell wall biosynthesis
MSIKLSILIASTQSRLAMTNQLLEYLHAQAREEQVEILVDWHESNNIGTKRNNLLKMAQGEYIVFVDSDDEVAHNYIDLILKATETGPDCIGISGVITINSSAERPWHISKDYGMWYERGAVYYRTPNHISPVKRELALKAGFPEIKFAEDYEYSMRLLPLLKSEVKIPGILYYYRYAKK